MAVIEKNRRKFEIMIAEVENSKFDPVIKSDLIDCMHDATEATNGYTSEEKLQAVSEIQFNLTMLFVRGMLTTKPSSRVDVIIQCKWQIVIICFFITMLLVFRPQFIEIFNKILH